jgi:hypothetical protein
MASWVLRYLDDHTLLIALGDHQAAPWVTGSADPTVPVHVFAKNPALVQPFLDWGFKKGAYPADDQVERRMDQFRDWFVHAYSDPNAAPLHAPAGTSADSTAGGAGAATHSGTESAHP